MTPPTLRPSELRFWQTTWFLSTVLTVCVVALGLSLWLAAKLALQTRAQRLLDLERARIARDIHDDLGAALTQLVLQSEVAQTEYPEAPTAHAHFSQFCCRARAASQALDEVVWAVNSKRDTLRDFSSYLCKYAQTFLSNTPIRCRLDIQPDMPASVFDLSVRRGLLLAVKEALNNAAKHSGANEILLRINKEDDHVIVVVEDQGRGFDPDAAERRGQWASKHDATIGGARRRLPDQQRRRRGLPRGIPDAAGASGRARRVFLAPDFRPKRNPAMAEIERKINH